MPIIYPHIKSYEPSKPSHIYNKILLGNSACIKLIASPRRIMSQQIYQKLIHTTTAAVQPLSESTAKYSSLEGDYPMLITFIVICRVDINVEWKKLT